MACIYCDHSGYCTLFDPNFESPGVDEDGICICEEDEDPTILCEDYESDGNDY